MPRTFSVGDRVQIRNHWGNTGDICRYVRGMVGVVETINITDYGVRWIPVTPNDFEWFNLRSHNLYVEPYEAHLGGWFVHALCLELVPPPIGTVVHTTTSIDGTAECENCQSIVPTETMLDVNGQACCTACFHSSVECARCGELVLSDSAQSVGENLWCSQCADNYAVHCDFCGSLRSGDEFGECQDCGLYGCSSCLDMHDCEPPEPEHIHSYSYNPHPFVFHGDGPRYFGVELEIDEGGHDDLKASRLLDGWSDDEQLFYIKEDGSLRRGFEIVTHPASLAFHREGFPWAQVTKLATELGYSSHDTSTCGLHVHVSRAGTGNTRQAQDITLSKMIFLFWRHWARLTKFSRRELDQLTQWADINYTDTNPMDVQALENGFQPRALLRAKIKGKYAAINTEHPDTLEIRIFRGTLRPDTILASIELVDLMVDLSMQWSFSQIVESTWAQVIKQVGGGRAELAEYLASKRMVKTGGSEK